MSTSTVVQGSSQVVNVMNVLTAKALVWLADHVRNAFQRGADNKTLQSVDGKNLIRHDLKAPSSYSKVLSSAVSLAEKKESLDKEESFLVRLDNPTQMRQALAMIREVKPEEVVTSDLESLLYASQTIKQALCKNESAIAFFSHYGATELAVRALSNLIVEIITPDRSATVSLQAQLMKGREDNQTSRIADKAKGFKAKL